MKNVLGIFENGFFALPHSRAMRMDVSLGSSPFELGGVPGSKTYKRVGDFIR